MPRPKIVESPQQVQERRRIAVLARMLRAALGWSQRELGARLGVTDSAIAKFEQGRLRLKPATLAQLMAVFEQAGLLFRHGESGIEITVRDQTLTALDPETGLTLPLPALTEPS